MTTIIGGRYSLEQVLGQGGMATVYEATDTVLNRTIALKMIRPELYDDVQARERFLREAQVAAGFNHPHIARVYDVGEDPTYGPYFIQELIPGQSLDTLLPLPAPQALTWTREVASALDASHAQGIVHCDVKPQNVRITPDGNAILIDFGVAEAAGATSEKILGTPHYLAPERALGDPPTPAADIYALGVLLYELLTGHVPIDGSTPIEVVQRHINEGVPGLRAAVPGQAAAIEAMITKATRRDPGERYASMADFVKDLEAIEQKAASSTVAMAPLPAQSAASIHTMPTKAMGSVQAGAAAPAAVRPAAPPVSAPHPATNFPAAAGAAPVRRKGTAPWVLALGALAAVALLFFLFRPTSSEETAQPGNLTPTTRQGLTAPPLVGLDIEVARGTAERLGLQLEPVEQPGDAPTGQIISQDPAEGATMAPGDKVRVVVSLGGTDVVAPTAAPVEPVQPPAGDDDKGKGKGKGKGKKDK